MALIRIGDNALPGIKKDKSVLWESSGYTPNEAMVLIDDYRRIATAFARRNKVASPHRFFEVRIIQEEAPSLLHLQSRPWWTHPKVMDRVFWVYQKPVQELTPEGKVSFYVLEVNECLRVWEILGKPKGIDLSAAYIVPVECVSFAWDETVNGQSEHIHWRPEVVQTQEEIDREARLNAEAQKYIDSAFDVSSDNSWFEGLREQVTKQLQDEANALGKLKK